MSDVARNEFIHEYTRNLLIRWANHCVLHSTLPTDPASQTSLEMHQIYIEYAQSKGWLSSRTPLTVLAKGFTTAASQLKR